jgi:hypothetical protein
MELSGEIQLVIMGILSEKFLISSWDTLLVDSEA